MTKNAYRLFPADSLGNNQSKAIELDGKGILVCNAGGEYYAVDNRCTHQGSTLTDGRIRNCLLSCPLHGARFDLRTGQSTGQLTKVPLKTYEVQVNADGDLELTIEG